jgi:hypothetical protein
MVLPFFLLKFGSTSRVMSEANVILIIERA